MSRVAKVKFTSYAASITRALDLLDVPERLPQDGLIILKPNLTNRSRPPVTTNVEAIAALLDYCKERSTAQLAIGEGTGSGATPDVFEALGYRALAERHGARLIDFNAEPATVLHRAGTRQLKEFHIPTVAQTAFIISVPVLKDHSFTTTTIAMKNMFGLAPAPFYKGSWNKSKLHSPSTHRSVVDVCLYKKPDLCVVDAAVALSGSHLFGTPRKLGLIFAGWDPVAVDAVASRALGHDPSTIEYLRLANGVLGSMQNIDLITDHPPSARDANALGTT